MLDFVVSHLYLFSHISQVEFPEARIYEETLNIILYENRNPPDQELMQATSTRGTVAGNESFTVQEQTHLTASAISHMQNNTSAAL